MMKLTKRYEPGTPRPHVLLLDDIVLERYAVEEDAERDVDMLVADAADEVDEAVRNLNAARARVEDARAEMLEMAEAVAGYRAGTPDDPALKVCALCGERGAHLFHDFVRSARERRVSLHVPSSDFMHPACVGRLRALEARGALPLMEEVPS